MAQAKEKPAELKARLSAQLEAHRATLSHEAARLKASLSPKARLEAAYRRRPALWLAGSVVGAMAVGKWLFTTKPVRSKRRDDEEKASKKRKTALTVLTAALGFLARAGIAAAQPSVIKAFERRMAQAFGQDAGATDPVPPPEPGRVAPPSDAPRRTRR